MTDKKREYLRKWYQAHPEKKREYSRKYYKAHGKEIRERDRKYRQAHPEKEKERCRKYRESHPEKEKERCRKYRESHREEIRKRRRKFYKAHPEKIREWGRKYRESHREEKREYHRKYRNANREKIHKRKRKSDNKRRRTDPKYRLNKNIAGVIGTCLKGKKAGRRWQLLVGYTLEDLEKHLEKQFDDKMRWENYGSYWDLDHIKPVSLFHFILPEDPEFKQCWALKNLQPLEHMVNVRKSNHY